MPLNYEYAMVMTTDKLTRTKQVLQQYPSILAAYLHGSTVKGTARAGSDVDIAVLPKAGEHITLKTRLECAGELESVLGCPVDIGELSTRNLIYAKEVVLGGQELFSRNPFESERFMATCLAMYSELQQQRKEVLDAYTA